MGPIVLENEKYRMEISHPEDAAEQHLFTRFSHCGYIRGIKRKSDGIELFARPKQDFYPFSGEGFPDEFETPLLYDVAAPDDGFIKIGVGLEQKKANVPYTNWDMHPIMKRADTEVALMGNTVIFSQEVKYGDTGYQYIKEISLEENTYRISHTLKNIGITSWKTLWYSHAFVPVRSFKEFATLLMNGKCSLRKESPNLKFEEGKALISVACYDDKGECFRWDVQTRTDNYQTLLNDAMEVIYAAEGDYDFQELQVYINDRVISIEPKLIIALEPKEQKQWSTKYLL